MKKQCILVLLFVVTGWGFLTCLNTTTLFATEGNDEDSSESFVMASIVPRDTPEGKWLYLTYNEAFKRLGLKLDYRHYPSVRAGSLADQHKVEGELARSYHYGKNHPLLIRVEEHGITNLTIALATDPKIKLNGWESLRNTTHRILFRSGSERTAKKLAEFVKPELLGSISDWPQGFKKLVQGEADIFIVPEIVARRFLNKDEFQDNTILTAGIIETISIHAYLHKTHALLASQLSQALKEMKKEGFIDRYKNLAGVE